MSEDAKSQSNEPQERESSNPKEKKKPPSLTSRGSTFNQKGVQKNG